MVDNFIAFSTFASNVFFLFLVLHSVQWIVSDRIYAHARRLDTQNIAQTNAEHISRESAS
jgi:hypothetical protein